MTHHQTFRRRDILRLTLLASATGVAHLALGAPTASADLLLPLSPLAPPDANGWRLANGFSSRVIATSGQVVAGTAHTWHTDPDGGAVFGQPDGSYIYVSNNEGPPGAGGVGAVHFEAHGTIRSARSLLEGSERNCAGGATPWGTWLSCEERLAGRVWECDPTGAQAPVALPSLGYFYHEAAATDPDHRVIYMTEDRPDGGFYRFTPHVWGDLSSGTLQILAGTPGALSWRVVPDPTSTDPPTRSQVLDAVAFNGGEGILYADETIFFSTKGDNRIWQLTTDTLDLSVIYDGGGQPSPILNGVDNLAFAPNGDLLVCEDSSDLELVLLETNGNLQVIAQLTGVPGTELTGAAFDPSGTRLYVSSQRNPGVTYELSGPFDGLPPLLRFETNDPVVDIAGGWFTWTHPSQSAGSAEVTTTQGATLRVGFTGSSVRLLGQKGPNRSAAHVRIDGAFTATIDTAAANYSSQQLLFSTAGLGASDHLLEVVHAGNEGTPLVLDALEAQSIAAPPTGLQLERIENDDPEWIYTGDWFTWTHPSQSAGSAAAGRGSASASLPFSGDHLRIFAQTGPDRAIFAVHVDAVLIATVDTWDPSYRSERLVFDHTGLGPGHHELELTVTGANPAAAGDPALALDAVETTRGLQAALIRLQNDDPRWVYSGNWSTWTHPTQTGGSAAVGRGLGSAATIRFTGTAIRWIGQIGPERAIATVEIDGVAVQVVDTYNSTYESRRVLFSASGLTDDAHTLTITYAGINPFAGFAPAVAALLIDAVDAEGFD